MMIALGAAKGLAFLHNAERPVIYRDFKTSNILLDSVSRGGQLLFLTFFHFFGILFDPLNIYPFSLTCTDFLLLVYNFP